jgi:hypothetical protein
VKDAHALIVQKNPTGCKFALSHARKKLFFICGRLPMNKFSPLKVFGKKTGVVLFDW